MTKKKRLALARAAQKAARERRARAEAEEKAAVAYWLSGATRRVGDPLPGRSAVSSTERSHAFRARGREITIPRVRHRRVRESCRFDLLRFGLVYDAAGRTNDPDIYGAGDVSGLSPIWPVAVKEGMIAAANMCGVKEKMTDFFASKSTMRFLDISTMSLGNVNPDPEDDTIKVETYRKGDVYKKIVHQDGKIIGALLQGDLAYGGVLQQMIARKIDVRKVKKPLFDIDYSDFFHIRDNDYEFYYD